MATEVNDPTAVDYRQFLARNEAAYLRAREYVKSEKFVEDQLKALGKLKSILSLGDVPAVDSMRVVGRMQQVILDTFEHEGLITEYEDKQKTLKEMFPPK